MTTEKPAFATGFGQSDTRKASGQPYSTITGRDIVALIETPQTVAKDKAQWFIPTCYAENDARCHDAQRTHGAFWWLTLDIDQNDLALVDIQEALASVLGDACRFIYSSRSATEKNRKWRALVPLASPITGADFADTQNALFDLLEIASAGVLIPDRALARTGQLVYLPNRGEFYQHHIGKGQRLVLTDHAIIARREAIRADLAAAAKEAAATRNKRAAERAKRPVGGDASVVASFNARHAVADLMGRYNYVQAGSSNDWRSPFQTGGSCATRVYDGFWISLSASDASAAIGAATQNGYRHGDAFDLFCHFEHGGNFKAAVAAYGLEIRPERAERQKARDTGPDDDQTRGNNDPPGSAAGNDPVDLWGTFPAPELPLGLLPSVIEQFAIVQGEMMGADPAGLAVAALVTCAAAIDDKIQLQVKRHDPNWRESARLWAALVGSPSTKKSPILSAATAPLSRLDGQMFRDWQKRVQVFDALSPEERKGKQRPLQTRLRIEDSTIEAAQQVLEGSP